MRALVLSDLHLDLWREHAPRIDPSVSNPDIVILAGDIHNDCKGIAWAAEQFAGLPVVYVSGNHEPYGDALEKTEKALREAAANQPNVHYLNCDEYIFENVRFLGCTLWTDFFLFGTGARWSAMIEARSVLNDYHRIRRAMDFRTLHPSDTARIHAQQRSWLKRKLAEPFDGKTAVVTHMAPSMRSVAPKYASDPVSAAFASNLDELVEQADIWIHGHMHQSFDYQIGRCRVVCNPCGYMTKGGGIENGGFDSTFTVEI